MLDTDNHDFLFLINRIIEPVPKNRKPPIRANLKIICKLAVIATPSDPIAKAKPAIDIKIFCFLVKWSLEMNQSLCFVVK